MRTHYVNADFDLSLRARRARGATGALRKQVEELTLQGLLGAREGDRALLRCEVPDEFLGHLASCGLSPPVPLRHPRLDPATQLRPFGWNDEAIALDRRHTRPSHHPELSVVRRVNARSFGVELERELGLAAADSRIETSLSGLESCLVSAPAASRWVVKSEHGNAGLGNLRLGGGRLGEPARRFIERCLEDDDRIVLERWLPRRRDWCTIFDVPLRAAGLRTHETVGTDAGAWIGALFEPAGPDAPRTLDLLRDAAGRIASRLEREGYFGPVCLDSFTWLDRGVERLRPLVDLNCRRPASDRAHALWRRLAPDRTLYYRFFNLRRLGLPAALAGAVDALGPRRYDPARRSGVLLASPLRITADGASRAPIKLAVAFVADDRRGVRELARWLRETFER